jgi:hypothetical protein
VTIRALNKYPILSGDWQVWGFAHRGRIDGLAAFSRCPLLTNKLTHCIAIPPCPTPCTQAKRGLSHCDQPTTAVWKNNRRHLEKPDEFRRLLFIANYGPMLPFPDVHNIEAGQRRFGPYRKCTRLRSGRHPRYQVQTALWPVPALHSVFNQEQRKQASRTQTETR